MIEAEYEYHGGEAWFDEPAAASILNVCGRTLRRWRCARKVPFTRTPGGRIRYTLTQMAEIRASMMIGAAPAAVQTCPNMSGELRGSAE